MSVMLRLCPSLVWHWPGCGLIVIVCDVSFVYWVRVIPTCSISQCKQLTLLMTLTNRINRSDHVPPPPTSQLYASSGYYENIVDAGMLQLHGMIVQAPFVPTYS
jgi:hypothetical protein